MVDQGKISKGLIEGPFLCIVNPNSGTGNSALFIERLDRFNELPGLDFVISESPRHSLELASNAKKDDYQAVIAVGGDGSMHEIGTQLIGTEIAFGIVPTGSGNGVARHLGISLDPEKALHEMLRGNVRAIDTFSMNNRTGIGFAGIGIDGHVAKLFDKAEERGFSNYVKLSLDAFFNYKSTRFEISIDDDPSFEQDALTVICANTSQLGNNAVVNATGLDDDGLLELVVIEAVPAMNMMTLASRLFLKTLHKSPSVKVYQGKSFSIKNIGLAEMHIDGEAMGPEENVTFSINPSSLNALIP